MAKPNDTLAIIIIVLILVIGASSVCICRSIRRKAKDAALLSSSSSSSFEFGSGHAGSTILPGVPGPSGVPGPQGMPGPPGIPGRPPMSAPLPHPQQHMTPEHRMHFHMMQQRRHAAAAAAAHGGHHHGGHHGGGRVPPMRPPAGYTGIPFGVPPPPLGGEGRPAMVDTVEGGRPKKDKGKKTKKRLEFFLDRKPQKNGRSSRKFYHDRGVQARGLRPVRQDMPGVVSDGPRKPPSSASS